VRKAGVFDLFLQKSLDIFRRGTADFAGTDEDGFDTAFLFPFCQRGCGCFEFVGGDDDEPAVFVNRRKPARN